MAWTCVFSKQSLPPALCGHQPLPRHAGSRTVAPLLPKLRGQFAEFLNHSSPDRLGILYLTTCVGLGYGPRTTSLEAFLGSIGSLTSPDTARHHVSPLGAARVCLRGGLHAYPRTTTAWAQLPSCVTPSLTYTPQRSRTDRLVPEGTPPPEAVSVVVIGVGVVLRVREYQPVVHRLRLSASP